MFIPIRTIPPRTGNAIPFAATLAAILLLSSAVVAQQTPDVTGDYNSATVDYARIMRLHIKRTAEGGLTGTVDIPGLFEAGDSLEDIHLEGRSLSFTITRHYDGEWRGTVAADGSTLSGSWVQWVGTSPLNFIRFVPAAKPSPFDGIWLGTLNALAQEPQRVQIAVKSDVAGEEFCTMDLPDQRVMGLDCAHPVAAGSSFSFDVPAISTHWSGELSAGGDALTGTVNQGKAQSLNFLRQSAAVPARAPIPPVYDPAIPPVDVGELKSVLDRDLAEALKSPALAPAAGIGISIGVVEHGIRRVFSYGSATPESIFEIGSITKTFTGLMLAQLAAEGKVTVDEPVRALLPAGTVVKPAGPEITLLDLATMRSGLRWEAANLYPRDVKNPYADYSADRLYAFLRWRGVAKPANAPERNSELAFGLLGHALANRMGASYPVLLKDQIAAPLGLHDTAVQLSAEQQLRLVPGHDAKRDPAPGWEFDALAGLGAIRSTAGDLLTYLEAWMHPENIKLLEGFPGSSTLAAAIAQMYRLQGGAVPDMGSPITWRYDTETGNCWHNGATGGYSSYAFFNPKGDYAGVVLLDASPTDEDVFVDRLGQHIAQRLAGKPAI
jgi:CubicO group peptidase (beta-lactamase class C family)